jgi:hypothetical protein
MPTQDRRWGDHKRRPSDPGKQTGQQGQRRSIRGLKVQTTHLTAQDLELMPQDRDLHILRDTGSEPATEDVQEATGKQIDEPAQHRPTLLETTRDRLMTPFTLYVAIDLLADSSEQGSAGRVAKPLDLESDILTAL